MKRVKIKIIRMILRIKIASQSQDLEEKIVIEMKK